MKSCQRCSVFALVGAEKNPLQGYGVAGKDIPGRYTLGYLTLVSGRIVWPGGLVGRMNKGWRWVINRRSNQIRQKGIILAGYRLFWSAGRCSKDPG